GHHQVLAELLQHHLEREALVREVVYDQDVDFFVHRFFLTMQRSPKMVTVTIFDSVFENGDCHHFNGGATRVERPTGGSYPPAWRGSPRRPRGCTSRGRPSSPWRSPR